MKITIDTETLMAAQAATWSNELDRSVEAYNLGYALVKTDLEIMNEIHKFESLPTMLKELEVPASSMSSLHKAMVKIIADAPSAHRFLIEAARELVAILRSKIALIYQLLGLTRSELGREKTADDQKFEMKYFELRFDLGIA